MGYINKPVILMLWGFGFLSFNVYTVMACVSKDTEMGVCEGLKHRSVLLLANGGLCNASF